MNLDRPVVSAHYLAKISARYFSSIWMAPPCAPFCTARESEGAPQLFDHDGPIEPCPAGWEAYRAKCLYISAFIGEAITAATAAHVPFFVEQPADVSQRGVAFWAAKSNHGHLYRTAQLAHAAAEVELVTVITASCGWGSTFRKLLEILAPAHLEPLIAPWRNVCCTHEFSGHTDVAFGRDELGAARSARSAPYPSKLNGAIAEVLVKAVFDSSPTVPLAPGLASCGPSLAPSIAAACESARNIRPRYSSFRNLLPASPAELRATPLPVLAPPRPAVPRREYDLATSNPWPDGAEACRPIPIESLFEPGSYAKYEAWLVGATERDMLQAIATADLSRLDADTRQWQQLCARRLESHHAAARAPGNDRSFLIKHSDLSALGQGAIWDTSNRDDCVPLAASDRDTVFPGEQQLSRQRIRDIARELQVAGWGEDADLLDQIGEGGLEARSACPRDFILSRHHPGFFADIAPAIKAIRADEAKRWSRPGPRPAPGRAPHPPTVPCHADPRNVILRLVSRVVAENDGSFSVEDYEKARVASDLSYGRDSAVNAGVRAWERAVQLPTAQGFGRASAVVNDAFTPPELRKAHTRPPPLPPRRPDPPPPSVSSPPAPAPAHVPPKHPRVHSTRSQPPPGSVYIGRSHSLGGGEMDSARPGRFWGNRIRPTERTWRAHAIAVREFMRLLADDAGLRAALRELAGLHLVCHCGELPCHGDVLCTLSDMDEESAVAQLRAWLSTELPAAPATAGARGTKRMLTPSTAAPPLPSIAHEQQQGGSEPEPKRARAGMYAVDLSSAYRFVCLQLRDLWCHCFLWIDRDGRISIYTDTRLCFGGSYGPNRFQRLTTLCGAHCALRLQRFDDRFPPPPLLAQWAQERARLQTLGVLPPGPEQRIPRSLQLYLDDFNGNGGTDPVPPASTLGYTDLRIDEAEMRALGLTPAPPDARVVRHASIVVCELESMGFKVAGEKTLAGTSIISLGLQPDLELDLLYCPGNKRRILLAHCADLRDATAQCALRERKAIERVTGRLGNLAAIFPELGPLLQPAFRISNARSSAPPHRLLSNVQLSIRTPNGRGFHSLCELALAALDLNTGVPLAPASSFPKLSEPGSFSVTGDASGDTDSGDAGAGGFSFHPAAQNCVFITHVDWSRHPRVLEALRQSALKRTERASGVPRLAMPTTELWTSYACTEALLDALFARCPPDTKASACFAITDCSPAAAALNRASSKREPMRAVLLEARRSIQQWLGVWVRRELNTDADLLSHPSRIAEVCAAAAAAGLTLVDAPVPERCIRTLEVAIAASIRDLDDDDEESFP